MVDSWSSSARVHAEARVGTILKHKWRLDRLLGIGGMSAVYAATHRTGHTMAIKLLHAVLTPIAEVRARFAREPYISNRIPHEGVIKVFDDDVAEDGTPYVVMELLEGESLDEVWSACNGRLPVSEVVWIADRVLEILAAAHSVGVLHRDIKPQNVFVTRGGAIKLLDFGIARLDEGSSVTQTIGVLGSPAFMPPEQARGRWQQVDARSDIWAVGAMMFTLLSGQFVHEVETPAEYVSAAMGKARSIAAAAPSLSPALVHVIDRALAFAAAERWQSAQEMRAALRETDSTRDGPPAILDASSALRGRVGPGGTVLIRDSFPDWSVPDATLLDAPQPGAPHADASRTDAPQPVEAPKASTPVMDTKALEAVDAWYVSDGARVVGPVTRDLLQRGIEAGKVPDDSLVCHDSWAEWRPLAESLDVVLAKVAPPLP